MSPSRRRCPRTWGLLATATLLFVISSPTTTSANENTHYLPPLECVDPYGRPQRCIPEFENAAYQLQVEATNTCGEEQNGTNFCVQTGYSNRKSCDVCERGQHSPHYLTDFHDPNRPTWWQSETMFEGVQYPNQVNLTLKLGKSFDITYIRIVFHSPRPESFAIYKRVTPNGPWTPYQYYSATCRDTYGLPDSTSVMNGEDESRALCTSEYSDISPLRDGNIAFSSLEGRPSAINFDHHLELQQWVTATDIRITLDRLNTFGDEVFGDEQVLKSYFYAIADIAVGARCKCNGHASECTTSTGLDGHRTRVCKCMHYTDGPDCDRCLPFYNDAPWGRATSKNVHECKPCNCNGYSTKCFFDRHLYNLTGHGGHCIDCGANRDGPNCERCKENFFMREDGYCINCGCDSVGSRSLQCNAEGKCQCKPGVTGEKCDRCDANFFNFGPHGCQPCNCDVRGSHDNTPSCDPVTGVCSCKENVEGRHCRECRLGYFNLDAENKFGCTPCFCYGHTLECTSANGYSIVSTTSNFNKHKEKWTAVTDSGVPVDVKYNSHSQSIGVGANGHRTVYFLAPDRFLGDQRASYNRLFKFRLQIVGQPRVEVGAYDVVLQSGNSSISLPIFAQNQGMPSEESREFAFRLHENPEYLWNPSNSARGFMSILSNLTAIKIRAIYSNHGEAVLDDVELQTAHRGAAGRPATWIEQCTCPEGYLGQFCESCAPGYRHNPARGGPFMPCVPCDCNKHAEICDSETGRCICQHNTAGDTCDQCAKGYYGNALGGTPYDCKRCPCPNNGACMQMAGDTVMCLECPVGYFGSRCELCSDGYYGDPTGVFGSVRMCQQCDCNGNVDPNAVGNCNRTTGECLKCIHNTAGPHCDQCLPGHFGDPLAEPHGNCEECSCYPRGTEQTEKGISICDQINGNCHCKPNVIGRTCNECKNGYWNIVSGNGCESCNCDPVGSFNSSCDTFTGECFCKPGVVGKKCDKCAAAHYGFSEEGCHPCECDPSGSKGSQCNQYGQCPCNENVEGRRCDRCKENKYDRHQGCLDCPACYNLVQDAANAHRAKLAELNQILQDIQSKPIVIDDSEFAGKLYAVQEKIEILVQDAKSGSGGGEKTLNEILRELESRLQEVQKLLDNADQSQEVTNHKISKGGYNATLANTKIQDARRQLDGAVELLQTEGNTALARAKEISGHLGNQTNQISGISREARQYADRFKAEADANMKQAQEAHKKASEALKKANDMFNQQANITKELDTTISGEIAQAREKLSTVSKLTEQALTRAREVNDEALTLFATVNRTAPPNIDINQIKKEASAYNREADRIADDLTSKIHDNAKLLDSVEANIELAETLYARAQVQKDDAVDALKQLQYAKELAEKAVAEGDGTLRKANYTYHTLAGFKNQVEESSKRAEDALNLVPNIERQIANSRDLLQRAEEALNAASRNAEDARKNAQDAQDKYAEEASKLAENIKKRANATKNTARDLHHEADQLNGRLAKTDNRLEEREAQIRKDLNLTNEAKERVGQAKRNSNEATSQVDKAMKEVNLIMTELNNLREIDVNSLDDLERRLSAAEKELEDAQLTKRLNSLTEAKNIQNQNIRGYQKELDELRLEVKNIELIASSLPSGCFKRAHLEP
ncbi:laminin subunit gamma-1 [Anopheles ziemanni]|uniref:laminin subunit gamma-1 n=1 Tax=Anopheles coustani TaxID=139045 RepID=UPI00265B3D80|nr:laminin subunit gamma-1 [Anopheles coustani]XP_058178851.1 laminin subunit gamma-1 [Anopheles ziemanni]